MDKIIRNIIYLVITLGTLISLVIVYKDIDHPFAIKFVIGYVILIFLSLLYIAFMTLFNLKTLDKVNVGKRLLKFLAYFIAFGILNYLLGYIFRPEKLDLLRVCSTSFGISFGLTFYDIMFLKRKKS